MTASVQSRPAGGPRVKSVEAAGPAYATIEVRKLTPIIGAEIVGIDLTRPPSEAQLAEIRRALAENQVIFFRDQPLSADQHLAFGRQFGDLHIHPAAPHVDGLPELMIIHADRDSTR
jgi:taurine dioxygenase